MQTTTLLHHNEGLPGQIAQGEVETETLKTRLIGQKTRLTIGNPYTAAFYRIQVNVSDGYTPIFEYDGTADGSEVAAGAGLTALWNTSPTFRQLAIATSNGDGTVDLAWLDFGRAWTVQLSATNAAVFTSAVQQAASATTARFGVIVTRGAKGPDPRDARPLLTLTGSTTLAQLRGMVCREDAGVEQKQASMQTPDDFDFYPAPRNVPVLNRGMGWPICETAMTADGPIYVRRAGAGIIGAVRNTADGGNTLDISSIASVEVGGIAGRTCKVKFNIPL